MGRRCRWTVGWALVTAYVVGVPVDTTFAADKPTTAEAEARRLLLTGRYEEALSAYQELAKQEPRVGALGAARCLVATGKYNEAQRTLRAALEQQPQAAELNAELAELLFQCGQHDEAAKLVEAALALEPRQFTARWLAAELHRVAGRIKEAQRAYAWFVDDYNAQRDFTPDQLRRIGWAAAQYARWKRSSDQFQFLVSRLYPEALKIEKNYWPAHLDAALLFLEKYNEADAAAELDAALAINPQAAEVYVARAQLALQKFDLAAAKTALDRALEINPQSIEALRCRADSLLIDLQPQAAAQVLEQARGLNPRDDETLGRLAAAWGALDGLRPVKPDSRAGRLIAEVTGRNPHCGDFYLALADGLDSLRRCPAAAEYYREADRRLPQLLYARGQLGLLYMRLGREAEATTLLEQSFALDPFNVRVKNMLEVLDVLKGYGTLETEHFVIRFDRERDELLARYVSRYLEDEVYPRVVEKLGYRPPDKTLLEIFCRARNSSGHSWFSARMVGLPFIGTVAACAGQMIAMTSPSEMPQKFSWARVLRHEFVHVVSLQQTDFNIPHWYTEALAVQQEGVARPTAWTEALVRRSRAGTLFTLDSINHGFIRPQDPADWTLAYCQADLYAEFLQAKYGATAPAKLLAAYAENQTTAAAVKNCFGVKVSDFEAAYRQHVDEVVRRAAWPAADTTPSFAELQRAAEDEPRNAALLAQLADAYLQRREYPAARKYATAAREREPNQPLAAYVLARVYLTIGDSQQAREVLQQTLDEKSPQPNHLALLAGLLFDAGDVAGAERLYRRGLEHCRPPEKWLKLLTRIYLKSGEQLKLTQTLRQLADADADNFLTRKKLLELAIGAQDFDAAAKWATEAMQIDVRDAEVHAQLAQTLRWQERYQPAIAEFETALQLSPDKSEWRVMLADTHELAGAPAKAREVLQELLRRDPQHDEANKRIRKK